MKRTIIMLLALLLAMHGIALGEAVISGSAGGFSKETALFILDHFIGYTEADMQRKADALGLEVALSVGYDKDNTDRSHTCAWSLLTGQMTVDGETRNAAVIAIRGTGAGEWYSNYDFAYQSGGDCEFAENFMSAAQDVFVQACPVIDAMDDPFIIATGYSRGAAAANLLGMLLDDRYGLENVLVYTFATPNTARGSYSGYTNIFNICNAKDSVTHMPAEAWGFSRLGTDIIMSDPEVDFSAMQKMFDLLIELAPDIDSYYNLRHSLLRKGLSDEGLSVYDLTVLMCDLADTETRFGALGRLTLAMTGNNDFDEFLPLFIDSGSGEDNKAGMLTEHGFDIYRDLLLGLE